MVDADDELLRAVVLEVRVDRSDRGELGRVVGVVVAAEGQDPGVVQLARLDDAVAVRVGPGKRMLAAVTGFSGATA